MAGCEILCLEGENHGLVSRGRSSEAEEDQVPRTNDLGAACGRVVGDLAPRVFHSSPNDAVRFDGVAPVRLRPDERRVGRHLPHRKHCIVVQFHHHLHPADAAHSHSFASKNMDDPCACSRGGDQALRQSVEGAEDCEDAGLRDIEHFNLDEKDTVIGISCSGAASYVISALDHANEKGAKTVYLVTNPSPHLMTNVDTLISIDTGPEIITGSTRMKAGTATKMILNMISTTTMIKLGKVYGNLMVDLMAVNRKLIDRGTRIIMQLTGLDYDAANKLLEEADRSVKLALVMQHNQCGLEDGKKILENADGFLNRVLKK